MSPVGGGLDLYLMSVPAKMSYFVIEGGNFCPPAHKNIYTCPTAVFVVTLRDYSFKKADLAQTPGQRSTYTDALRVPAQVSSPLSRSL